MQAVSGHENRRCFRVCYRREFETWDNAGMSLRRTFYLIYNIKINLVLRLFSLMLGVTEKEPWVRGCIKISLVDVTFNYCK